MRVPIKLRRLSFSMETEATTLSQTSTCKLITHQHLGTMIISHMEVEHSKVQVRCRIFNNSMLYRVPRTVAARESKSRKSRQRRSQFFEDQMLTVIGENKRLLNIHEHKFAELETFQENTKSNINASLKNLDTQVGQSALAMQN